LDTIEKDNNFYKMQEATKNLQYEVASKDRTAWKGSWCELQYQFKEFIVWIEMFSLSDIEKCHQILSNIYKRYVESFGDVEVCTWIYARHNQNTFRVYSFDNANELLGGITAFGSIHDVNSAIDMEADIFRKFD